MTDKPVVFELGCADKIILNAMAVMDESRRKAWLELNKKDGITGLRHHEREALLAEQPS